MTFQKLGYYLVGFISEINAFAFFKWYDTEKLILNFEINQTSKLFLTWRTHVMTMRLTPATSNNNAKKSSSQPIIITRTTASKPSNKTNIINNTTIREFASETTTYRIVDHNKPNTTSTMSRLSYIYHRFFIFYNYM